MNIRFEGKRALVTGAGQGIGRAVAKALAEGGAETFALSKTQANLDKLKAEVPSVKTLCVDVSDWDAVRAAVTSLGRIDLLVNNAGYAVCAPVLEATQEHFDKSMSINVKAAINISQVLAAQAGDHGMSIVNVSSQASQAALSDHLMYGATKAALDQVTRVMALELGPKNIRVNAVNPTVVWTEMSRVHWSDPDKAAEMTSRIPMGRFAEVKDIVHPILFLLSDKSDMINGIMLPIDGGFLAC